MWTSNITEEVLEQFADVRWANAHLMPTQMEAIGMFTVHENDNWYVRAKKTDEIFRMHVLEAAAEKHTWRASELAEAAGDRTHGGRCAVGLILGKEPGWILRRPYAKGGLGNSKKQQYVWTNRGAVLDLCRAQLPDVSVARMAKELQISQVWLARWLYEAGWVSRRLVRAAGGSGKVVWNPGVEV